MQTAIWWIRRDVRLVDNQALAAALDQARQVIPVFIIDPRLLTSPYASEKRIAFLFGGLRALDDSLRARGNRLVVRRGDPLEELSRLQAASGAGSNFRRAGLFAIRPPAGCARCPPLERNLGRQPGHPPAGQRLAQRRALYRLHALQPGLESAASAGTRVAGPVAHPCPFRGGEPGAARPALPAAFSTRRSRGSPAPGRFRGR